MKKQIKKTNARQTKRLQLDKTAISSFDAKQVKGGTGGYQYTNQFECIPNTGRRLCRK